METSNRVSEFVELIYKYLRDLLGSGKKFPKKILTNYDFVKFHENESRMYSMILRAKEEKDLSLYCDLQYMVDTVLQLISIRLHYLFSFQKKLLKELKMWFDEYAKERTASREYLLHNLKEKKVDIENEINLLKDVFNDIICRAEEIGFQVFKEDSYTYNWYFSLYLTPLETYSFFQREGIPEKFLS